MAERTDLELIEAFRNGEISGFNELVRRYQEKVYWIARRIVGSHEEADDVAQDVFIRVHGALSDFRGESGFYTWVYRIAVNISLNALRKKKLREFVRFEDVEEVLENPVGRPDEPTLKKEYDETLERAIARLPARQKAVFIMRYYEEMPYEEMSKVMKKSVGGLKANYFHALRKVMEYVKRESMS